MMSLLSYPQGAGPADRDAVAAQVTFPGVVHVIAHEDHAFRARLDAGHAQVAFLRLNVIGPFVVLVNGLRGADFSAVTALGAHLHLEDARGGEAGDDAQGSLFGVVLTEQVQRTCHQAGPTA